MGADGTAVVLVAHGSRDRRATAATRALTRAVAAARPEWDVRDSYLDHTPPRPAALLTGLAAAGYRRAVLVPLLLTAAYHGRVDVPAEVTAAREAGLRMPVVVTDVLGPLGARVPTLLLAGLTRRLGEAGTGLDAVVLAAAGTRDGRARASVGRAAAALSARLSLTCRVAYASAAPPAAGAAVDRLRRTGALRVGLAAYFLAPGLLYDAAVASARHAGAAAISEPLLDAPELVRLVGARVDAALAADGAAHAG